MDINFIDNISGTVEGTPIDRVSMMAVQGLTVREPITVDGMTAIGYVTISTDGNGNKVINEYSSEGRTESTIEQMSGYKRVSRLFYTAAGANIGTYTRIYPVQNGERKIIIRQAVWS